MKYFEEIHLLYLYSQVFHVPILWALLSYLRFCLCLSSRRLLRRVSKHKLLSKSLIQHFWRQPLANVLTSTQTPRLRSTRRLVTLCHHLPSKQKHARRHYWSHNLLLLNSSMIDDVHPASSPRSSRWGLKCSNKCSDVTYPPCHHSCDTHQKPCMMLTVSSINPAWDHFK